MGKRLAGRGLFQGNINSIQWEITGLYALKGITGYDNGIGTNSREIQEMIW
jgi:hypothetical protein